MTDPQASGGPTRRMTSSPDFPPAARSDAPASSGPLTVYYDGACALCSVEIGHYATQRGSDGLCFVDASAPDAETGRDLAQAAALKRFHVRKPDGELLSGARAFVAIWDTLPAWRKAARLARLPGIMPMLEFGYRLFLPARPVLSRLAAALGAKPIRDTNTVNTAARDTTRP